MYLRPCCTRRALRGCFTLPSHGRWCVRACACRAADGAYVRRAARGDQPPGRLPGDGGGHGYGGRWPRGVALHDPESACAGAPPPLPTPMLHWLRRARRFYSSASSNLTRRARGTAGPLRHSRGGAVARTRRARARLGRGHGGITPRRCTHLRRGEYLRFGLAGAAMLCLEWWSFEFLSLAAGVVRSEADV